MVKNHGHVAGAPESWVSTGPCIYHKQHFSRLSWQEPFDAKEKQIYCAPAKLAGLTEFWEYYASVEAAVKLKPDEFIKNMVIRNRAIEGIEGLAKIISQRAEELLKKSNDAELPLSLASAKIITGSTADELSELLELAHNAKRLDVMVLYSNLVRFMEVFEEVYLALESSTGNK